MTDQIYQTLCAALEERKWPYAKEDDKRRVRCSVKGRDIPVEISVTVNDSRKLIEFISVLPCQIPVDKRIEAAIAVTVANYGLYDGSIIYSIDKGLLMYRMTCSYCDATVGTGLFQYMIDCGFAVVDRYNDRFVGLAKGEIDVQQFIAME